MGIVAKRGIVLALLSILVVYGVDDLWLRYRMARGRADDPLGSVTYYVATPLKNKRIEVFYDQPQTEICVRSLFPHLGYRPCWYAGRQRLHVSEKEMPGIHAAERISALRPRS